MDHHEGFFVGAFTFFLFVSTWLLWRATQNLVRDGQEGVRKIRAIIGGGGQRVRAGGVTAFQIEANNAGDGQAILEEILWDFGELKKLPKIAKYGEVARSGETLLAKSTYRAVRHVAITNNSPDAVIFFRFIYWDVNRGKRHHVSFVMQIRNPAFPALPIQLRHADGIPRDYLDDTFPTS